MLFQQAGGLNQSEAEAGLCMNLDFFLSILNGLNMGDCVNEVGYLVRPYETTPGATDAMLDQNVDFLHEVLKKKSPWTVEERLGKMANKIPMKGTVEYLGKFIDQLYSDDYTGGCAGARPFDIEVDRLRVKPIVVTGEFGQTTEATATSTCSASWSARARR
jgi:hypothetical protein